MPPRGVVELNEVIGFVAQTLEPLAEANEVSAEKPEVKAFVEFALTKGPALIKEVKYLPLPETAYKMGLERFKAGQLGTGFGGVPEVGLPVEEILKKEPTL
jgi:phosphate transport system substrate-binding protein